MRNPPANEPAARRRESAGRRGLDLPVPPAGILALSLLAGGLLLGGAASAQPRGQAPAQPAACGANLEITRSTQLEPNCRYTGTTVITGSNLVLDCRGATLDGEYKVARTLVVGGQRGVSQVQIRNCIVTGSRNNGVYIGSTVTSVRMVQPGGGRPDSNLLPQHVSLQNVTARRNAGGGIYIDGYVEDTAVLDSAVEENGSVGIYLDHDSRRSRIANSRVLRNGFGDEGDVPFARERSREGIAIDSSADNIIEGSTITGNKAGGIFLYRNCGERPNDPDAFLRVQPSSGNVIRGNTIDGGTQYGIAVASRQESRLRPDACMLRLDPARGVFADAAPGNRVTGNTIRNVPVGIRVSDDENVVEDNRIAARSDCIRLGSEQRNRLRHPVRDLTVKGNACQGGGVNVLPGTTTVQGNGPMTR
jgi:parallel beta-helix repeat protein